MLSPLLFNVFFPAEFHAVPVPFSQDEAIVRHLIQISDARVVKTEEREPLACARRAVWAMLYADDAGIVSMSVEGLAKMMTIIVTALKIMASTVTFFEAAGLTLFTEKTGTMRLLYDRQTRQLAPPFVTESAGQRYDQAAQFVYSSGVIHESADLSPKIARWIRLMRACLKRFVPELYDRTAATLRKSKRVLKAEVIETLL